MSRDIDPQLQTMIDNMPAKTGRVLEDWFQVLATAGLDKHGEMLKLLKDEHGVTHGFANAIVTLYRQQAAGGPAPEDDLVASQYIGDKARLQPIYETILAAVGAFGPDIEIAPKKSYVSLRRKKQFAIVQPSTKTRVDLGLNLKHVEATGRLQSGGAFSGMCSHKVALSSPAEVDEAVVTWLRQAYEQAG